MRDPEPDTLWGATSWSLVARAARAGSRADLDQAWVRLIEKYGEPVARGVRRILRGHPETDEILAEFPGYVMEREV